MRSIVNGKMYNTETATLVYTDCDWNRFGEMKYYRKKNGEIFRCFHAHDEEEEFPCDKNDVSDEYDPTYIERELKETLERENRVALYIELFGEPEE